MPSVTPPTAAGFVAPSEALPAAQDADGVTIPLADPLAAPADGAAAAPAAAPAAEETDPADGAAARTTGGIGALLRKHPVAWAIGAGAVAFALLGTGAVFAGAAWAGRDEPVAVTTPDAEEQPERPLPAELAAAIRLRTCSVAPQLADARLINVVGSVIRADTGEVLLDRSGTAPAVSGAVVKVLTAAAAVSRLGPDFQVTTSVYEGSSPGTIVLVGRGDATLSALPVGQESFYPGAPKLQTLAEATIASYRAKYPDTPITRVVLDATYWNPADGWASGWDRGELSRGTVSAVTALQVDGDRSDPRAATSPRSEDPVARAGAAFLDALRAADPDGEVLDAEVSTVSGSAVGSSVLAEVKSQPIRAWITQMLVTGDNTLAEMLARIVSREAGMGGTAASLQQAIPGTLLTWEVPSAGIAIRDGSGISAENLMPPQSLAVFMRAVRDGVGGLDVVRGALPVAGKSGALGDRFSGDNAAARNNVTGASGNLPNATVLSGYLTAADGTPLAFSFTAGGDGFAGADARAALDTLTTAVLRCGDNLTGN